MNKVINVMFFFMLLLFSEKFKAQGTVEMKAFVKEFFIKNGEINENNKLDVSFINIINGKDLEDSDYGIYIIRTVYRTDGNDFLFFKNKNNYEIVDFDNLKTLVMKTANLFKESSDDIFLKNLERIITLYNENKKFEENSRNRYKLKSH